MLWNLNFEISCRPERLNELCDLLNTHRCVILAKPIIEEGEVVKGGAPVITQSPDSKVECNAQVLHQSEEDNLRRHLNKVLERTERELLSFHPSDKRKVIIKHILKAAGITAIIVFAVIVCHSTTIQNRPLTLFDNLINAGSAAVIASVVEGLIIVREHNL